MDPLELFIAITECTGENQDRVKKILDLIDRRLAQIEREKRLKICV